MGLYKNEHMENMCTRRIVAICENNNFEYRFSMVFEYGPGCRRLENVGGTCMENSGL